MARIRSIHPGLFTDEAFMSASAHARLLLLALGTMCDYSQKFRWNVENIKACSGEHDVDDVLTELSHLGLIQRIDENFGEICFLYGFSRLHISRWGRLRAIIFQRDKHTCVYCGTRTDSPHCDHVMPVSRGGTDDLSNLVTACRRCNLSKHDRTVEEWIR